MSQGQETLMWKHKLNVEIIYLKDRFTLDSWMILSNNTWKDSNITSQMFNMKLPLQNDLLTI